MKTLLLTPWMTPHHIVSWQTAITLLFLEKIEILEEYEEQICSPSISLHMPAVARLNRPVSMVKRGVKFSRINVFSRDGFRCQYCGNRHTLRELNYDHVIPRTQGGRTVWENIVTSCYPCNKYKGSRTPEQAGMKLLKVPYRPQSLPISHFYLEASEVPPEWNGYCVTARDGGGALFLATG